MHGFNAYFLTRIDRPKVPEIDLVFAITATTGAVEAIFHRMRDAVKIITDTYGMNKLRYSVIRYGSTADTVFDFKMSFSTRESLKYFIERLRRIPGGPDTLAALEKANEVIKDSGTRPTAKTVLVLITDGATPERPLEVNKSIEAIEKEGVPVLGFVVRNNVESRDLAEKVMKKVLAGKSVCVFVLSPLCTSLDTFKL